MSTNKGYLNRLEQAHFCRGRTEHLDVFRFQAPSVLRETPLALSHELRILRTSNPASSAYRSGEETILWIRIPAIL
jgi:hypothetical protein